MTDRTGQVWMAGDLFLFVVVERARVARTEPFVQLEHKVLILDRSPRVDLLDEVSCVYEHPGKELEARGWERVL